MLDQRAGLSGKNAAIIGGGLGIGRAVSLSLAEAGVNLAICDRDGDALESTAADARKMGVTVRAMQADVLDAEALDRFLTSARDAFGRIEILVNVAGGTRQRDFLTATDAEDAADIRLNYGYVLQAIRAIAPAMPRGGSIISFTTIEAHRGAGGFSVYAGAKAAVMNLTRALAVELGPRGIRLNTVVPDTTPSQGNINALRPELLQQAIDAGEDAAAHAMKLYVPLQEAPTEQDLANAVLFLASDLARMVTGTALHVDGGTSGALGFLNWPHGTGPLPTASGRSATALFAGDPWPDQ